MNITNFPDVHSMQNIEHHFKVFAGPGAGKTKWLIEHLERVLNESKRLEKTRKIACITYTNVAADEIKRRINCNLYRIDVSTIHSFLYQNLIKPFSFLIENDLDGKPLFNIDGMTGHVEHIPRRDRVSSWITEINQLVPTKYEYLRREYNVKKIYEHFPKMDWFLSGEQCDLAFRKTLYDLSIPTKNGELLLYKKSYWRHGILHHEDVLYFSHYIISNYPKTLDFIRARFPYIFIDEFQDTTRLQTWIIKKIAEKDTIIGIIGDLAQSIYMFTGAQRKDFETFSLPDIIEYKKEENYRSSKEIITYLNTLRNDIQQKEVEKTANGHPVTILVGDMKLAQKWVINNCPIEPVVITRKNSTVDELKDHLDNEKTKYNLIEKLYADDSNKKRPAFIHSLLLARDYSIKGDYKRSIKELSKYLRRDKNENIVNPLIIRRLSVKILEMMNTEYYLTEPIFETYMSIIQFANEHNIQIASKYAKGKAKDFSEKYTLVDLIPHITTETNQEQMIRTIHSTKGMEFDSILLILSDENDNENENEFQKWIIDCNNQIEDDKNDDARIYYVGMSRAKKNLFINIPKLENDSNIPANLNVVHL